MKKKLGKLKSIEEYREGGLLEEISSNIKLVLEHVTSTDENVKLLQEDNKVIHEKLDLIEVRLVGKADTSRVEKLERRVAVLEH